MSEVKQFVGFMMGSEHYGVDIMAVEEIIRPMDITPVPRAPSFVKGIINLRGRIIPVVDLRDRLRIPIVDTGEHMRIVVMRIENRQLGFIVDRVEEVMYIPVDHIEAAPGVSLNERNYVEGVARTKKGMIILLDILKIFTPDEHIQMSTMA
ncbi:MAG: chemotaxis protein CheW [Deferribacteraceae bacterium]|jgi:purine-binding chemotaxis protein CheW|nr:chemotaxis protein CheW [Deferribacteraceae bacterium]